MLCALGVDWGSSPTVREGSAAIFAPSTDWVIVWVVRLSLFSFPLIGQLKEFELVFESDSQKLEEVRF